MSNGSFLIGICGGIGSGKDTVADFLVTRGFKRLGLADDLKHLTASTLRIHPKYFFGTGPGDGQRWKNEPIEKLGLVPQSFLKFGGPWPCRIGKPWIGRWVLEFLGTECFRAVYDRTWIDKVLIVVQQDRLLHRRMEGASDVNVAAFGTGCVRHVIPDIRFGNEFEAIREAGGQIWQTKKLSSDGEEIRVETGHDSDAEWRSIPPDKFLVAVAGDLVTLRRNADDLIYPNFY